jgi:hypothetical protein
MSLSGNFKSLMPRVGNAIIVTGIIACANPIAALAQPPDPCHSAAAATSPSAAAR